MYGRYDYENNLQLLGFTPQQLETNIAALRAYRSKPQVEEKHETINRMIFFMELMQRQFKQGEL
jgi:hypothetical protein